MSRPRRFRDVRVSRRQTIGLMAMGVGALLLPGALRAAAPRHGLSVFGDLKYGPGFSHFDYVDPAAPKGGKFSQIGPTTAYNQNHLTFNTLNGYILKGDAAQGLELIFDSLMVRAEDEPDAVYGLVAASVSVSDDGHVYSFTLRPEARFHDGSPLTAEDAAFSLNILKEKGHPLITQALAEMQGAAAKASAELVVSFSGRQARSLPLFVATLPIFSKAWYASRPFDKSSLEPPLGSGPYRIGAVKPGRTITYERVADYWGADLPVNRGRHNFDQVRFEYYRDRTAQFEAFKAGEYTLREEFTSKTWATGYDFPAIRDGRVKKLTLPDHTPSGAQGWFINTRRRQFADPRVREALILAFDFEWTNKVLFYGAYRRTHSYFQNSEMMASGPPSKAELALLEPFRSQLPEEVFAEPFTPPENSGKGQNRAVLRRAARLLRQAGWTVRNGLLRDEAGRPFALEFLETDPGFERITLPFIKNLTLLGIHAKLRMVDPAQYQSRLNTFDFDITTRRFSMPVTLDESIRRYWSSADADISGSNNMSGIKSKVIDALTDRVIGAASRAEQIIAARALDRVLRAGRYWVPQWYKGSHNLAYWDIFGRPKTKPRYARGIVDTWWRDPARPEPE